MSCQPASLPAESPLPDSLQTILIAEDDPMFRRILQRWLETWGFRVLVAEDGAEAWEYLRHKNPPEMMILDWVMPGMDGLEICRRARASSSGTYQYILLVTARDRTPDVVRGLDAGADDYLTKPFDKSELHARLRVGRRILALQHQLLEAQEMLRFQATHDALTGLWNRGALIERLDTEVQRAFRSNSPLGILLLDIDHFKLVNDTHGHLAGDSVLAEIALRITAATRSYDFIGRYGGEEFVVLLPGCDGDQTQRSAERIRAAVAADLFSTGIESIPLTISIGATVACVESRTDAELLGLADLALYEAKAAGRNRVVLREYYPVA